MLRSLFENNPGKGAKKRKRNFWLYSMGEFVLIFLGILIALQVENLNENRQDRKLERILLSEMRSNLISDLGDIDYNIRIQQKFLNSNQIVLGFLQSDLPWHDSLSLHFATLMAGSLFDNNNSAYESLKSIGIDLIRNDSLRQQITLVYTARYHKVEKTQDILLTHIFDHLHPALRANLQTIVDSEKTVPINLDELRQKTSFTEDLHLTIFVYKVSIQTYQAARKDMIKLIEDIEKELS